MQNGTACSTDSGEISVIMDEFMEHILHSLNPESLPFCDLPKDRIMKLCQRLSDECAQLKERLGLEERKSIEASRELEDAIVSLHDCREAFLKKKEKLKSLRGLHAEQLNQVRLQAESELSGLRSSFEVLLASRSDLDKHEIQSLMVQNKQLTAQIGEYQNKVESLSHETQALKEELASQSSITFAQSQQLAVLRARLKEFRIPIPGEDTEPKLLSTFRPLVYMFIKAYPSPIYLVTIMSTFSVVTRPVLTQLLLPTFLIHLTRGLTLTTIPLFVLSVLELNKLDVGLAVGAIGLGKVTSDIPSGYFLSRIGPKKLMIACGLIIAAASILMLIATGLSSSSQSLSFLFVTVSMFFVGVGESTGVISRLAIVSDVIDPSERGRISALLGGSARIAMAVGPLISGLLTFFFGYTWVFIAQFILALASVAVLGPSSSAEPISHTSPPSSEPIGLHSHLIILSQIIVFVIALQVVRECRKLVIPLAGYEIGLPGNEISFYSSLSFTIDAFLFTAAGTIMDSHGRVFTGVLSVSVMILSLSLLVPAVTKSAIIFQSVLSGIGNGLSSGLVVAFGADMAPTKDRAGFLGLFRLFADSGELIGPTAVGLVAQYSSIPTMINAISGFGIFGVFWLIHFVKETERIPVPEEKEMIPQAEVVGSSQSDDDRNIQE
jgi:MFS family permease